MCSTSSSASSSASLPPPPSPSTTSDTKYQVLLSFRGADTRDNFISHLYKDLRHNKGIQTFIDNYDLERGDKISESLSKAIEESKIAVIVFSKGYASSTWCLDELTKIIDCVESRGLIVLPIFYHVYAADVRKQSGTFGKAFAKHEERFKEELEKVQIWRNALTKAADLSGFDSKVIRPESALVEEVGKNILKRLNSISTSDNKDVIGVKSSIREIEKMIKSKDVLAIGIWGMGGIGKTTLACMIFDKMEGEFDNAYFQKNVREESKTVGLFSMQKKLLSNILNDECTTLESIFTKKRLRCKKILIVLDDVTSFTQKEELIGNFEHFSPESRIIITSRDKQVLQNCGIIDKNIYEVKGLQDDQGLRLFSRYAFEQKNPPQDYMELSKRVVKFVKGVPLALKVFGSMLFQKSKATWESLVLNIERISILEIQDVLKLSYDELNDDEKNIFLDISCFLKDVEEKHVMEILEANGLASKAGIDVLFNKSLITTSIFYNDYVISMHDLLQEMGRKIVKEESKDPGKRSRLWHHEDICRILSYGTGTETVEAIHLDISKIRNINLNPFAFSKMPYLRSLDIFPSSKMSLLSDPYRTSACQSPDGEENENKVLASQGLNFISAELRYLRWFKYPLKSLPSTFDPGNLVLLVMPHSEIEQLGNGVQHFNKVKIINLSHSKHLNRIPDLSLLPNLECLILDGCSSLTEIHSSRRYLRKLVLLNLRNCKSLIRLPPSLESNSLTYVDLSGCSRLEVAPKMSCSVEEVYLSGTSIKQLPMIESPSRLRILWLNNCSRLESIPSTICELPDLERLSICGCSKIERLPYDMGNMKKLCSIEADYIALRELPPCIKHMDNLKLLSLQGCKGQELADSSLSRIPCSAFLLLNLSNCEITKLPDSLGQLSSLTVLNLSGNKFERIPANIRDLTNLLSLDVSYCEKLQSLPKLPSFLAVQAHNCTSLEALPDLSFVYRHWTKKSFNLANCFKLSRNALKAKVESSLKELQSEVSLSPSLAPFHSNGTAATMCYPGNEIPEFFSFQKVGSSITLELPLDCMKKSRGNTVKFVACVVVTFRDHHTIERPFPVHFNCKTEGKFGKMKYEFSGAFNCLENEFKMSFLDCLDHSRSFSMKSDHVFLWYDFQFPKDWLPRENGTKSFNRMSAVPIKWKEIEEDGTKNVGFYDSLTFDFYIGDDANDYIQVEKCGVRLLFDPDEQEEPAKGRGRPSQEIEIFQFKSKCLVNRTVKPNDGFFFPIRS